MLNSHVIFWRERLHFFFEVEETNILQVCDTLSILIAKSLVTGFGSMVHYLMEIIGWELKF